MSILRIAIAVRMIVKQDDCMSKQNWTCITDIESTILELGPENISAFIAEPIVGSQQGAVFYRRRSILRKFEGFERYEIV